MSQSCFPFKHGPELGILTSFIAEMTFSSVGSTCRSGSALDCRGGSPEELGVLVLDMARRSVGEAGTRMRLDI